MSIGKYIWGDYKSVYPEVRVIIWYGDWIRFWVSLGATIVFDALTEEAEKLGIYEIPKS